VAGYKLFPTQQAEAIKMIRLGAKSQAEIAELFIVDRSTISRMMKGMREKELSKSVRWWVLTAPAMNFGTQFRFQECAKPKNNGWYFPYSPYTPQYGWSYRLGSFGDYFSRCGPESGDHSANERPSMRRLMLIVTVAVLSVATAHAQRKTIVDYVLELPENTFEVGNFSVLRLIREQGKGNIDIRNGFIYFDGDAVDGATQIALFTSRGEPPLLAIVRGDYMGVDFNHLNFYVESNDRMVAANRMILPVLDDDKIRFDLPQYGVTVSVRKPDGTLLSRWTWNGRKFVYGNWKI
jgi:hypothetical protein